MRIHSVSLLNSVLFHWKIFSLLSSDPMKQGRTNGFIKYIYFRLNGRSNYIPLMQENSWNQLKVPQSVKQNIKRPDQKLDRFTDSKQSVRELSVQLTYLSCLLLFPFFPFAFLLCSCPDEGQQFSLSTMSPCIFLAFTGPVGQPELCSGTAYSHFPTTSITKKSLTGFWI